jgi:hypothetical protein
MNDLCTLAIARPISCALKASIQDATGIVLLKKYAAPVRSQDFRDWEIFRIKPLSACTIDVTAGVGKPIREFLERA